MDILEQKISKLVKELQINKDSKEIDKLIIDIYGDVNKDDIDDIKNVILVIINYTDKIQKNNYDEHEKYTLVFNKYKKQMDPILDKIDIEI